MAVGRWICISTPKPANIPIPFASPFEVSREVAGTEGKSRNKQEYISLLTGVR